MKIRLPLMLLLITGMAFLGCNEENKYHPGGPYYYKSTIINYQPFRPNNEITKKEAAQLSKEGHAFYIAYFNSVGKPTVIEKHYQGSIDRKTELFYKKNKLFKTVTTNTEGNQKIDYYNK